MLPEAGGPGVIVWTCPACGTRDYTAAPNPTGEDS